MTRHTNPRVLMIAMVACSTRAYAHVRPEEALFAWNWDPLILTLLGITAGMYVAGVRRSSRGRTRSFARREVAAFWCGWTVLCVSLISPIHKIGAELFSVHMTQHTALMLLAAPLLVIGRPLLAFVWALPLAWRERVGRWTHSKAFASGWRFVSTPLVVWMAHGVTLWMWHAPSLYTAALGSESVHALQHSMFLATALLFWWTLVHGRYGRIGYGAALLYIFTTAVHSGGLGALLTLSEHIWFPIHEGRTEAWHLSVLQDQQLAGLIMWIPAGVIFLIVALAMLAAWLGESERRLSYSRLEGLRSGGHDA